VGGQWRRKREMGEGRGRVVGGCVGDRVVCYLAGTRVSCAYGRSDGD
jgi:hypothetical protein